jgi:lysophospholipase L1-like esterase
MGRKMRSKLPIFKILMLVVAVTAVGVGAAIQPLTSSSINSASAAAVTQRATLTVGSPNGLFSLSTGTDYLQRVILTLPANTTRWRLIVANQNAQTGSVPGTSATISKVSVGTPAYSGTSRWNGNTTGALTPALTTALTVPASGADATSDWVTATNAQFTSHTPLVLSMGMTVNAGGTGVIQADNQAYGSVGASSQVGAAAPTGMAMAPWVFDTRIQYEVSASPSYLVGFVVGASGESGYTPNGDTSTNPTPGTLPQEAWPEVMGLRNNNLVINGGLGGSSTNDWVNATKRPYSRFDLTTTVPNYAIIGMLASNDISGVSPTADAATVASALNTIETNMTTISNNLRAAGIKRVFYTTIAPRGWATGSSQETLRQQLNAWIRSIPGGIENEFDFDNALASPTNPTVINPLYLSNDGVHPLRGGQAIMGAVPVIAP